VIDHIVDQAVAAFQHIFGQRPATCGIGPGRVEILGNHTDYNGGCVLTAAIDRAVVVVGRPCTGDQARVHSEALKATARFSIREPARDPGSGWADYVKGVVVMLQQAGVVVPAFEAVVSSDLPLAAGLSSSAALETATAQFLGCMTRIEIGSKDLALLLQRAENEFVGVRCGILDQFSSIHGRADHLLFLDCATLEHELLPLGDRPPAIVLCDSQTPRSLATGHYNARRAECEQAAAKLAELLQRPVDRLCSVTEPELAGVESRLPDLARRRARHVLGENERVLRARSALRDHRLAELGRLMAQSQESSRVNFENSTDDLDVLCRIASEQPGCLGSRLCGAGWGGNTVNLVAPAAVEAFESMVAAEFEKASGRPPIVHVCRAADGARAVLPYRTRQ
jgi:galactokinase